MALPKPENLNPKPKILNPTPYLGPKPHDNLTRNPKPETRKAKPETRNPNLNVIVIDDRVGDGNLLARFLAVLGFIFRYHDQLLAVHHVLPCVRGFRV